MRSTQLPSSPLWGTALLSLVACLACTALAAGDTPTAAQRQTVADGTPRVTTLNDLVSASHCDFVAQHHSNATLQSVHAQHIAAAHDYLRALASRNGTSIDHARLTLNAAAQACAASPSGPAGQGAAKGPAPVVQAGAPTAPAPAASPAPTPTPKPVAVQTPAPAQKPAPNAEPTRRKPRAEPRAAQSHKPGEAKPAKPAVSGTVPKP